MKGLLWIFEKLFTFVAAAKPFIPKAIVAFWILISSFVQFKEVGFSGAFQELGIQLFSAEQNIRKLTDMAIANDAAYGFTEFFGIIASFFIIYYLVKWMTKFIIWVAGAQAIAGAIVFAILIFAIIEMAMIRFTTGEFGFFPFKDGVWYAISNLNPIVNNLLPKFG